ncbi:hypothetical protein KQX54_016531 [Cotesia glomerata]|uniref:Uncharacterized protein n=1 Tax=Cotesia glomerata TaxID=32391 RepID=A0AAV7IQU4_COTGL|nr:hypothetical protein KQX54_016531 [Cotesia glomerata]
MFISIEQSRSLDQSLQPHMEENLEDRIHPVNVEESNENTGSEIEDYFSDSSEEFNDAERIENSTYENEVESNRHHEDNSNIDSSDSDSEDTSGLNNPFFSVNTPTFSFPFISKPNLTENDHLLAILAISTRNNFSFEAMLSIFTWMKITHTNNNLPTTKKALWKVLHRDDTLIKRHLCCGVCKEHIGVVTSPHERAVQVVMRFLMTKFVESAIYSDSISTETKKFICNILKIPNLSEEIVIHKDFQVVSSPEIVRLQEVELTVLQEADYASVNNPFSYAKIKMNGTEYQSQNNNDTKYCNSVVSFGNKFGEILSIIDFHNEANTKFKVFL